MDVNVIEEGLMNDEGENGAEAKDFEAQTKL